MPTLPLPLIRSTRIDSASRASARSSASPTIFEYLTPASGLNSYVVTTGPGWISFTVPITPNSLHFDCRMRPCSSRRSLSTLDPPLASSRIVIGGRV